MDDRSSLTRLLIDEMLRALADGLAEFGGPARVAFLYAPPGGRALVACDPHDLLGAHTERLAAAFPDGQLRPPGDDISRLGHQAHKELDPPRLPGCIAYAAATALAPYQAWFVERPPSLCSRGPIQQWLRHAAELFAHELMALQGPQPVRFALHDSLRNHAKSAIAEHLRREFRGELPVRFYEVLTALVEISTTREEGRRAVGSILFPTPASPPLPWARFAHDRQPLLSDQKHVRKLLTAVSSGERHLISDGERIVGIGNRDQQAPTGSALVAAFGGARSEIRIDERPICTIVEGKVSGRRNEPTIGTMSRLLRTVGPGFDAKRLLHIVPRMIVAVRARLRGCTLVFDPRDPMPELSGQPLAEPVDIAAGSNWRQACQMALVDGALHLDGGGHLHAIGCLLDGLAVRGERRSFGARFNSALRYSSANHGVLVVVLSGDGPLSAFHDGKDLMGDWSRTPLAPKEVVPQPLPELLGL